MIWHKGGANDDIVFMHVSLHASSYMHTQLPVIFFLFNLPSFLRSGPYCLHMVEIKFEHLPAEGSVCYVTHTGSPQVTILLQIRQHKVSDRGGWGMRVMEMEVKASIPGGFYFPPRSLGSRPRNKGDW